MIVIPLFLSPPLPCLVRELSVLGLELFIHNPNSKKHTNHNTICTLRQHNRSTVVPGAVDAASSFIFSATSTKTATAAAEVEAQRTAHAAQLAAAQKVQVDELLEQQQYEDEQHQQQGEQAGAGQVRAAQKVVREAPLVCWGAGRRPSRAHARKRVCRPVRHAAVDDQTEQADAHHAGHRQPAQELQR